MTKIFIVLTQFDIPMKAHFLSGVCLSSSMQPSSSRGWRAFRGILGLSSARPTSSRMTTEVSFVKSFLDWYFWHCLNVPMMPSEVARGEHWKETMWTSFRFLNMSE